MKEFYAKFAPNVKIRLCQFAFGRILLHLGCLSRGGRLKFHIAGIRRELNGVAKANAIQRTRA